MKNNTIITISRQYGSGGRLIGQKLAERLGIPFYDKELITLAAEESGFAEHLFEKNDRNITNSLALFAVHVREYHGTLRYAAQR